MTEFEVPVVVRHSIRCARIFFFGLVDFHKLDLYECGDVKKLQTALADGRDHIDASSATNTKERPESLSQLKDCCENKFILTSFKKIGQRISNSQKQLESAALNQEEAESEPKADNSEASAQPEPSSLIQEEEGGDGAPEEKKVAADTEAEGRPDSAALAGPDHDETAGRRYVVYANINSQIEDFSFLVTVLYHWEELYPAICPTQPSDPKPLLQKASKASKMVAPEGKELRKTCSKGHSFLTLTEKPPYYGGGVVCDACRKRISGEEFLHCKDCKEDYCSSCKFVAKKEPEPADKGKNQKKGEEPASSESKQNDAAPAKEEPPKVAAKEELKDAAPE